MRWDYVVEGKVYGGVSGFVIAVAASRPVKGTSAETSSLLVLIWNKGTSFPSWYFPAKQKQRSRKSLDMGAVRERDNVRNGRKQRSTKKKGDP